MKSENLPPVAVFYFRRPHQLRRLLQRLDQVRPAVVFGISDGPRQENREEAEQVRECRDLFRSGIRWPCRLVLRESEDNLGCGKSIVSGLNWVFGQTERVIILEDDVLPDPSFFPFCAELLERFADEPRVGAIAGSNYLPPERSMASSYRLSRYHHSWGWATWRRAWQHYDHTGSLLVRLLENETWNELGFSRTEQTYWSKNIRAAYAGLHDSWDYPWIWSMWNAGMGTIHPQVNLTHNTGFDQRATHTHGTAPSSANPAVQSMSFPLSHPSSLRMEPILDQLIFRNHYAALEGRRTFIQKIIDRLGRDAGKPLPGSGGAE